MPVIFVFVSAAHLQVPEKVLHFTVSKEFPCYEYPSFYHKNHTHPGMANRG